MKLELMNKRKYYRTIVAGDDAEEVRVDWDEYEYICPCGRGKIVESIDGTPGYREHNIWLLCEECKKYYEIDTSRGKNNWKIVEKKEGKSEMVRAELLEKGEVWKDFLEKLDNDKEFDRELKDYLDAIKVVSEISVGELNSHENREKLSTIENFINKYKDDYYELSLIRGFKVKEGLDEKDYRYYIADQKMKASVYYVRYLNFISKNYSNIENTKQLDEHIKQLDEELKKRNKDININKDNIVQIIDNYMEDTKENRIFRQNCLDCIERLKMGNINYLKYMLFNNVMKEIRYIGSAYQFLWHWESTKKTIYRAGTIEYNSDKYINITNQNLLLKNMLSDSVFHMNFPSKCLHSYSENLLLDIYKYLVLERDNNVVETKEKIYVDNRFIEIEITIPHNNNSVCFYILKEASINCIFIDGKVMPFQDFAICENIGDLKEFSYSVEVFPQSLYGEKNAKGTTKYLRDIYFPEYFNSLGLDGNLAKTKIADDKEVITYGKYYQEKITVDSEKLEFDGYKAGTLFCMTLTKEDVLCLILRVGLKKYKSIDYIINIILSDNYFWWQKGVFKADYEKNNDSTFTCNCHQKNAIWNANTYNAQIIVNNEYFNEFVDKNGERLSLDKAEEKMKEEIKKYLFEYLYNRYNSVIEDYKNKVEFILSTVTEDDYDFGLVSQYNEYMKDTEDHEIAILKEIIFKE